VLAEISACLRPGGPWSDDAEQVTHPAALVAPHSRAPRRPKNYFRNGLSVTTPTITFRFTTRNTRAGRGRLARAAGLRVEKPRQVRHFPYYFSFFAVRYCSASGTLLRLRHHLLGLDGCRVTGHRRQSVQRAGLTTMNPVLVGKVLFPLARTTQGPRPRSSGWRRLNVSMVAVRAACWSTRSDGCGTLVASPTNHTLLSERASTVAARRPCDAARGRRSETGCRRRRARLFRETLQTNLRARPTAAASSGLTTGGSTGASRRVPRPMGCGTGSTGARLPRSRAGSAASRRTRKSCSGARRCEAVRPGTLKSVRDAL